jgi:glycosyltransferase involved in cell wall biosynthesis
MIAGKAILSLSPFPAAPLLHGAITRIHYINKGLAETNQLFFVFRDDPNFDPPGFTCEPVPNRHYRLLQIFNPLLLIKLLQLIHAQKIDIIFSSHIWCGFHGVLLKVLTGRPFLFDNHNVEHLRFKRMKSFLWPFVWLLEWTICQSADKIMCVSEKDQDYLIDQLRVSPNKICVVPNGVDVEGCRQLSLHLDSVREKLGIHTDELMVLFFGMLDYQPNITAVEIIFREILPRLGDNKAKIVIAGAGGDREWLSRLKNRSDRVIFTGFVEKISIYIKSADVIIVPLTAGSGTRFKIIESVGCGRRVVSTSIGAEGLDQRALGDSLVTCDNWDIFTQAIMKAAKKGPVTPSPIFIKMYDWHHIMQKLQGQIERLKNVC